MKKLPLARIMLSIMLMPGLSICYSQSRIDVGVKAGLSIPNLTSGSSDNPISTGYSSRLDADAAVHVEIYLNDRLSVQPQLEYSSQGGKKSGTQAFTLPDEMAQQFPPGQAPQYVYATYKSVAKMNYLMLPVFAKYHFIQGKRWNAYAAAGPFVSLLINAKNVTTGSSLIYLDSKKTQPITNKAQSFDYTDNVRDELRHFNAGISGHLGLSYKLEQGRVFIEAGGNYGFIDIQKNDVNGKNKTGAAVINIGYQFRWR